MNDTSAEDFLRKVKGLTKATSRLGRFPMPQERIGGLSTQRTPRREGNYSGRLHKIYPSSGRFVEQAIQESCAVLLQPLEDKQH